MKTKETVSKDLTRYQQIGVNTNSTNFQCWLNGGLLNDIDENFVAEVQRYWEGIYGKSIDPSLQMAFMNYTGKKDVRVIPGKIMRKEILPVFNDYDMSILYKDKNLYDILINPPRSAETVLKNINGTYFDANNYSIDIESASKILLNSDTDLIIKPSRSNNGKGIVKLIAKEENIFLDGRPVTIHHLDEMYEQNFIIQKAIQQHDILAAPHPSSVNTLRMVTFRWKNEIRYLLTFARFGSNNDIRDNAGAHSGVDVRVGVSDSGEFSDVAVSQHGETYTHHPTTGFCFADLAPIPNFDEFKQFVKKSHKNVLHLDIISWDVAMGIDNKPIFIEANFAGSTPFYQLAAQKPMFGDLTDEVLQYVSNQLKTNKPLLMKKDRNKLERKRKKEQEKELKQTQNQNFKLKKRNQKLKLALKSKDNEVDRLEEKIESLEEKYNRLIYSKSWRYTQPFRSIIKSIKR